MQNERTDLALNITHIAAIMYLIQNSDQDITLGDNYTVHDRTKTDH